MTTYEEWSKQEKRKLLLNPKKTMQRFGFIQFFAYFYNSMIKAELYKTDSIETEFWILMFTVTKWLKYQIHNIFY